MNLKHQEHQTSYGVVTETYEDADRTNIVHSLRFQPNDDRHKLTDEQITEIIETVTESIENRYPEGQAPCNLAVQLMRLHMTIMQQQYEFASE